MEYVGQARNFLKPCFHSKDEIMEKLQDWDFLKKQICEGIYTASYYAISAKLAKLLSDRKIIRFPKETPLQAAIFWGVLPAIASVATRVLLKDGNQTIWKGVYIASAKVCKETKKTCSYAAFYLPNNCFYGAFYLPSVISKGYSEDRLEKIPPQTEVEQKFKSFFDDPGKVLLNGVRDLAVYNIAQTSFRFILSRTWCWSKFSDGMTYNWGKMSTCIVEAPKLIASAGFYYYKVSEETRGKWMIAGKISTVMLAVALFAPSFCKQVALNLK